MDKVTTKSANKQKIPPKNSGKKALSNIIAELHPQPVDGSPSVTIARLLIDAARRNDTPLILKGNKVCISINGRKNTLTADGLEWLINSTAARIKLKGVPITGDTLKQYISQLRHTIGKLQFLNTNKAA